MQKILCGVRSLQDARVITEMSHLCVTRKSQQRPLKHQNADNDSLTRAETVWSSSWRHSSSSCRQLLDISMTPGIVFISESTRQHYIRSPQDQRPSLRGIDVRLFVTRWIVSSFNPQDLIKEWVWVPDVRLVTLATACLPTLNWPKPQNFRRGKVWRNQKYIKFSWNNIISQRIYENDRSSGSIYSFCARPN